jgi:putative ABC transport system ATP-binding protein
MDALQLEGVRLDYPGRPGVLQGVSLRVAAGHMQVIAGRSGSGKSSLLAVASGLQVPTAGKVLVAGRPLSPTNAAQRAAIRGRYVGLVFQQLHLLGELTLRENVELPLHLAGVAKSGRRARAEELLAQFGLTSLAARRPGQVSGGEQQRTAIARALALRPALLLVDEPTSSLDEENALQVQAALQEAAAAGAAVLVTSHDELLRRAGPCLQMTAGRLSDA